MEYDKFRLADGRMVVLDDLGEQDLPRMMKVYNSVIEEQAFFPRSEGLHTYEEARQWYEDHAKTELFYLAARVNGELVGGATIEPLHGKMGHVAWLGIYLKREFRGLGIGTHLLKSTLEIARRKGFEMIELQVFASNGLARSIYEKIGFHETGRIPNGIRFSNGTYTDMIIMVMNLDELKKKEPSERGK